MSIQTTYSSYILENILKDILKEGVPPSVAEIEQRYAAFIAENDTSKPLFSTEGSTVEKGDTSSASKYNSTLDAIKQDIVILYRHLFLTADEAVKKFERWKSESAFLDRRLDDLNERIENLLLLNTETAGYFNFVQENFTSFQYINTTTTDTLVDVKRGLVSIGTSNTGATRVDLSYLSNKDITFTVLSRNGLLGVVPANKSEKRYAFSDVSNYWSETIVMSKNGPVSVELKVDFGETKTFSKISVDLQASNQNSTIQLTPMISTDGFNYQQLSVDTFTRSVLDTTVFVFEEVSVRYVKFIMTKEGYDFVDSNSWRYEFGFDEIVFYSEGYEKNNTATFLSLPLSVLDKDGSPLEFSKVLLETCEEVPEGTTINYYVAASVDTDFTNNPFIQIDPINRETIKYPTILSFGDLTPITLSNVAISLDPDNATAELRNPGAAYTYVSSITDGEPVEVAATATNARYSFINTEDKILDHSLSPNISFLDKTFKIWRNTNTTGSDLFVRDNPNGWGYEEPYYKTNIYIGNSQGKTINIGSKPIIVDGTPQTGNYTFPFGQHLIHVHKNNFLSITSQLTNLTDLKAADYLYPFNHKYLVEGYDYHNTYTDEEIYTGFDIVAEYVMLEVSPLDLVRNVAKNDFQKFAFDLDASTTNGPGRVILLKINEEILDFQNERFLIQSSVANQLYKYLLLKAEMSTTNEYITPVLSSYRLKMSY